MLNRQKNERLRFSADNQTERGKLNRSTVKDFGSDNKNFGGSNIQSDLKNIVSPQSIINLVSGGKPLDLGKIGGVNLGGVEALNEIMANRQQETNNRLGSMITQGKEMIGQLGGMLTELQTIADKKPIKIPASVPVAESVGRGIGVTALGNI